MAKVITVTTNLIFGSIIQHLKELKLNKLWGSSHPIAQVDGHCNVE